MSSVTQHLLTVEEFQLLPGNEHMDLVHGDVVDRMPPGGVHGAIVITLGTLLRLWIKSGAGGYVGTEAGFSLGTDTLCAPDLSYVRADRIPPGGVPTAFWTVAPDLAVEVISPSETAEEVREKVLDFFIAGTPLVWAVYARTREVVAHTPDGLARTYSGEDVLQFPDVLPGFSCKVSEIFE